MCFVIGDRTFFLSFVIKKGLFFFSFEFVIVVVYARAVQTSVTMTCVHEQTCDVNLSTTQGHFRVSHLTSNK